MSVSIGLVGVTDDDGQIQDAFCIGWASVLHRYPGINAAIIIVKANHTGPKNDEVEVEMLQVRLCSCSMPMLISGTVILREPVKLFHKVFSH